MRRLELDYVASAHGPRWAGIAVLALGCLSVAYLVTRDRDARAQLAALDATQGMLNAERPAKALPKQQIDEQMKVVNTVLKQLTLPWAQIIAAVENAASDDVVILQMQPEAQQRLLRLTAEAKNQKAMIEYVARLEQEGALADVHLIRHEVQSDDPAHPIQFGVQAALKEAGR